VYNPRDLIAFGQIVTSVGEGAYLGALANITSPSVRQSAGQIIGNEARQNSLLRTYERLNFFNALNFDTPITGAQAFSLASQYWTCPVGNNPPFNFTQIPPLNLTFANPNATQDHKAGDLVTATWNATQAFLGADVFVRVLSDVNDIQVPLNQTTITRNGTGRGTFALPAGINGTAFVV
ncbi:hypothetical protein ELE71_30300, partial [Klebsiella pneumoniae]|nr:hypothetical protein [Klebsiella pneumoniae]